MAGRVVRLEPAGGQAPPTPERPGRRRGPLSLVALPARDRRLGEVVRAGAGAQLTAFACGLVGADYVESAYFSIIVPALSGLACAWVVSRGAPSFRQAFRSAAAGGYGAISAAFAFLYADTPYGLVGTWLPPVAAGVLGAVIWPFVDPAPPGSVSAPRSRSS